MADKDVTDGANPGELPLEVTQQLAESVGEGIAAGGSGPVREGVVEGGLGPAVEGGVEAGSGLAVEGDVEGGAEGASSSVHDAASDDEVSWVKLCIVALGFADLKHKFSERIRFKLVVIRDLLFLLHAVFYVYALTGSMTESFPMIGAYEAFSSKVFPSDADFFQNAIKDHLFSKAASELNDAEQMVSVLNWVTHQCMDSAVISANIMHSWRCNLQNVVLRDPVVRRWNPFDNRALPDDVSDYPAENKKEGIQEEIDREARENANETNSEKGDKTKAKVKEKKDGKTKKNENNKKEDKTDVGKKKQTAGGKNTLSLLQEKISARALSRRSSNASEDTLMKDSMNAMKNVCSAPFLFYHVVLGDHTMPDSTSHGLDVDYGDREAFHDKVLSKSQIKENLDPIYDYDQVVQKAKDDSAFIKKFDKELNLSHRLDEIEGRVSPAATLELTGHATPIAQIQVSPAGGFLRPRSHRRAGRESANGWQTSRGSSFLGIYDAKSNDVKPKAKKVNNSKDPNKFDDAAEEAEEEEGNLPEEKEETKTGDYFSGCFQSWDIVNQALDEWISLDSGGDMTLSQSEFAQFLKELLGLSDEEGRAVYKKVEKTENNEVSLGAAFRYMKDKAAEMKLDARGSLTAACRNHHWSLLTLCTPQVVAATYRLEFIEREENGYQRIKAAKFYTLKYEEVGGNQQSSIYQLEVRSFTEDPMGEVTFWKFVFILCNILLIFTTLVPDALVQVFCLPYHLIHLIRLYIIHMDDEEDDLETSVDLAMTVVKLVDPRGRRSNFVGLGMLALEAVLFWSLMASFCESVEWTYFTRSMSPLGPPEGGRPCQDKFIERDVDYIIDKVDGGSQPRGLTPFEFLNYCVIYSNKPDEEQLTLTESDPALKPYKAAEALHRLLFSSKIWAPVVLMCMFGRLCDIFYHIKYMRWVPATLSLAAEKLIYFMVFYAFAVTSFALVMYACFNSTFVQYANLKNAFVALFMFSFGDEERARTGLIPFIDDMSTMCNVILIFYSVIVVTIGMGFFTTIVIDAYELALEQEKMHSWGAHESACAAVAYLGCNIPRMKVLEAIAKDNPYLVINYDDEEGKGGVQDSKKDEQAEKMDRENDGKGEEEEKETKEVEQQAEQKEDGEAAKESA